MKRYIVLHYLGVEFASGLHEVAEIVATLDCRHYFLIDTLDDLSIFTDMVRSLDTVVEMVEDLVAASDPESRNNADRR